MSDLICRVTNIKEIKPHSNADSLEIAIVEGWQVCTRKDLHKDGDEVVFVPPDALVPWDLAEKWGVASYLSGYDKRGQPGHQYALRGRVKAVRLRGEPSLGFIVPNSDGLELGSDAKEFYDITKWEPPVKFDQGQYEKPHALLHKYTDIQLLRNFMDAIDVDEEIVATEKIHGSNSVIGMIFLEGHETIDRELMVSSRRNRRKLGEGSLYEHPLMLYPQIEAMLNKIYDSVFECKSVILYGEVYGNSVQKGFHYGDPGKVGYVAFDIAVNGQYLEYDEFLKWANDFNIPVAPEVYRGVFDYDKMLKMADGNTLMIENGETHIREGVVIKPIKEKTNPKIGRVVLKIVSDDFAIARS